MPPGRNETMRSVLRLFFFFLCFEREISGLQLRLVFFFFSPDELQGSEINPNFDIFANSELLRPGCLTLSAARLKRFTLTGEAKMDEKGMGEA